MTLTTILVVEDEPVIADDLRETLGELGYAVPTTVATGEEAIDAARRLRPSLVLMDIKLRGEMDGVDAAKVIGDLFDIPVLYLTSHSSGATLARAAETRPHGFLVKPFSDLELSLAVARALRSHAVASGGGRAARHDSPPESEDHPPSRGIRSSSPPVPDDDRGVSTTFRAALSLAARSAEDAPGTSGAGPS